MTSDFQIRSRCVDVLAEVTRQFGTIEGRVRIQKTMYLLKRMGLKELDEVDFFYHHYGPFSATVAGSLADAVHWKILHESVESFEDDGQKYEYRRGSQADDDTDSISAKSVALVEQVTSQLRGLHWRTLELAATIDYLEQVEQLSPDEASKRAISLKPACKPYREQARTLLSTLRLPAVGPSLRQRA
jgi:uncharacterized protein YwgA